MRLTPFITTVMAVTTVTAFNVAEIRSTLTDYSRSSLESFKRSLPSLTSRKDGRSGGSGGSGDSGGSGKAGGSGNNGGCPAIWTSVVNDLSALFLDRTTGQCNDDARAAIRAAFHDCGTWSNAQGSTGGCDGSLILAREAYTRPENNGLQVISDKLTTLQQKYPTIGVADLIQVASSVAIVTCPQGPRVPTFVGRKDSSIGAPGGFLPDVHADASSLFKLFQDKGFSAKDLAALLGAHSTSKAFGQSDMPFGAAQDSTPGIWDVNYYQNTLTPPAGVVPFKSDKNLAADPVVGKEFKGFVGNQGKWTSAFADAMGRMAVLGVPGGTQNLVDCTGVIPKGTSNKREIRAAPVWDRLA